MNIKEYIESGVLELYISGALSEEEMQEVDILAAKHPQVKAELDEIRNALTGYAAVHGIKPADATRENILSSITGTSASNLKDTKNSSDSVTAPLPQKDNVKQLNFSRFLAAAAVILLLISAGINIYFYAQLSDTRAELAALESENLIIANNYQSLQAEYQQDQEQLAIFKDQNYRAVRLVGTAMAPDAIAMVYWDPSTNTTYINPVNLPAPPAGKQYQLWAIDSGTPVDAGVFKVETASSDLLQKVKNVSGAQTFAITLEPEGGSASPTLDQMIVAGNVIEV